MSGRDIQGVWVGLVAIQDRRVLLLKEANKDFFIFPGGKMEEGEDDLLTLTREIQEELGVQVVDPTFWRSFVVETRTTNVNVEFRLYTGEFDSAPDANKLPEFTERIAWLNGAWKKEGFDVGNLARQKAFPALREENLID